MRLKKKLKLSARLQLGRDSSGSVGIREGRVCESVCVRGGSHWLVGSIICWTGRPVTPPLERLLMKRKAA